jgi:hypothetical protein
MTRYRIEVVGELSRRFDAAFGHFRRDVQGGRTVLTGDVTDQAQLHGVLDMLEDLGVELVSVNPLGGEGGGRSN